MAVPKHVFDKHGFAISLKETEEDMEQSVAEGMCG